MLILLSLSSCYTSFIKHHVVCEHSMPNSRINARGSNSRSLSAIANSSLIFLLITYSYANILEQKTVNRFSPNGDLTANMHFRMFAPRRRKYRSQSQHMRQTTDSIWINTFCELLYSLVTNIFIHQNALQTDEFS